MCPLSTSKPDRHRHHTNKALMTKRPYTKCPETGLLYRIARQTTGVSRHETASIDISLSNPRCSGASLVCLLRWCAGKFATYEFSLGDTLYDAVLALPHFRHMIPADLRDTPNPSATMGERWIQENSGAIQAHLGSSFTIRRWDEWRAHPDIQNARAITEELFRIPHLQELVTSDCTAFFERKTQSSPSNEALQALLSFYTEECAVYFLHSRDNNVRHIYPGNSLSVLRYLSRASPPHPSHMNELIRVFKSMKRTDIEIKL
jgi:hypothetical protein